MESNSLKHRRCRSDSNKLVSLNRSLSKRKTFRSTAYNFDGKNVDNNENGSCNISNSTSFNSQSDSLKQPHIVTTNKPRRESSVYSTEQNSPLCNCFPINNDVNENEQNKEIINESIDEHSEGINKNVDIDHEKDNNENNNIENNNENKNNVIENNPSNIVHEKESFKNINSSLDTINEPKTNLVLCRICEEMILAENLGEHSKVCAVIQEQEMRLYDSSQKLKKLHNEYKSVKNVIVIYFLILISIFIIKFTI